MKPLTIDQLKALEEGDWVWIKCFDTTYQSQYVCISNHIEKGFFIYDSVLYGLYLYSDYGTKWLAYKNKEQAEANGEIVELPEPFIETDKNAYEESTYLVYRPRVEVYCPSEDIYLDKIKAELRLAELKGAKK